MARRSFPELLFDSPTKQQPFSLQHICRKLIIVLIIKSVGFLNVHKAVCSLPVPRVIVNYLAINTSSRDEDFDIRAWKSLVELGYSGKCFLYGELVTLKCIDLRRKLGQLRTEALSFKDKWMGVEHENILNTIVCFEENDVLGAIFEPCPPTVREITTQFRELDEHIEEKNIWKVVHQLCSALVYLGKHRIASHKLNSKTISITKNWNVKVHNLLMHYTFSGGLTPLQDMYYGVYLAPERIEGRHCPQEKQDSWLVGCIAYELMYKQTAFIVSDGVSLFETLNNIVEGRPPPNLVHHHGYSDQLIDFVRSSFTHVEKMRPSLGMAYQVTESVLKNYND